jgi:malonate-semialdehyde dehydrogenase (acetylating) / methylmalonate-semialdehyde dehydrogenase
MEVLKNFVGGSPVDAEAEEELEVPDPATGDLLGRVPLSGSADVDRAVRDAAEAFEEWREEPVTRRARRMFRLQVLLEEHMEELAELCSRENGKHVDESKGEILRGIEVVELAASMTRPERVGGNVTLYGGGDRGSYLLLPIIPAGVDGGGDGEG